MPQLFLQRLAELDFADKAAVENLLKEIRLVILDLQSIEVVIFGARKLASEDKDVRGAVAYFVAYFQENMECRS